MTQWIDWEKERPKERGYYLFSICSGGNSYGNCLDNSVEYFDPDLPDYGVFKKEYFENKEYFAKITYWMKIPPYPWESESLIKDINNK